MNEWPQFGLFAAALVGIGYFSWGLMGALGRIASRLNDIGRDLVEGRHAISHGLSDLGNKSEMAISAVAGPLNNRNWDGSGHHTDLMARLDAIHDALDDKKVRVMNVPTYSAPQNPAPAPQIGPNTSIRSDDPAIRTFFGQIQALGKAKRAEEAELEALRVQVRDERARLERLATAGTTYGRREDDQPAPETYIDEVEPSPGASETAFDDVMRRIRAKGEQK